MDAIATLGSEHEIHAIAACCENLVSGRAYKLGDVLTSMDGTTVEINNTDAEGRLTLGDAITYARTKVEPDEMFDFATLTGACMVALGPYTAGVMSDHDFLAEGLDGQRRDDRRGHVAPAAQPAPARAAQELGRRHAQHRRSHGRRDHRGAVPQDVRQGHAVGPRRPGGPGLGHQRRPHQPKGGTGFAVATIIQYVARS
jgi:leucyl aminopeptidase